MQRRAATPSAKDDPEHDPERAYGRRGTTFRRVSRDELLARFRQARRRLGEGSRR
jgi:hypothetical protein